MPWLVTVASRDRDEDNRGARALHANEPHERAAQTRSELLRRVALAGIAAPASAGTGAIALIAARALVGGLATAGGLGAGTFGLVLIRHLVSPGYCALDCALRPKDADVDRALHPPERNQHESEADEALASRRTSAREQLSTAARRTRMRAASFDQLEVTCPAPSSERSLPQ